MGAGKKAEFHNGCLKPVHVGVFLCEKTGRWGAAQLNNVEGAQESNWKNSKKREVAGWGQESLWRNSLAKPNWHPGVPRDFRTRLLEGFQVKRTWQARAITKTRLESPALVPTAFNWAMLNVERCSTPANQVYFSLWLRRAACFQLFNLTMAKHYQGRVKPTLMWPQRHGNRLQSVQLLWVHHISMSCSGAWTPTSLI